MLSSSAHDVVRISASGHRPSCQTSGGTARVVRTYDSKAVALVSSLQEFRVERTNEHAAFLVAEKKFAWLLNNHHGDGMVCICVKVEPETKEMLIEMN